VVTTVKGSRCARFLYHSAKRRISTCALKKEEMLGGCKPGLFAGDRSEPFSQHKFVGLFEPFARRLIFLVFRGMMGKRSLSK
jgi:hypothetical protein